MSAAIVKATALALLCLAPLGAAAQTSGESRSERGMPEKTGTTEGKSERAMPTQTKETGTPSASAERGMPSPEKR